MWLVYLYLIRDALIDLYLLIDEAWIWAFAGGDRPDLPAISRFLRTMEYYSAAIFTNGSILIGWALYNKYRYRGRDNRRARPAITVANLAELYKLPAEDIAKWQSARILMMKHDDNGVLTKVEVLGVPATRLPAAARRSIGRSTGEASANARG
jgi:poly-beta-1,6-N-acetyl-D-glucosamine biosynthesis protein PgaD